MLKQVLLVATLLALVNSIPAYPQTTAQEETITTEEKTSITPPMHTTKTSPKRKHDAQDPDCFKYIPQASTYSFIIDNVNFDIFGIAHVRKEYGVQNVPGIAQWSRNNYINMCFRNTRQETGNLNNMAHVNQEAYYGFFVDTVQLTGDEQDCFEEQVRNTLHNNFFNPHPQPQNNIFYPQPQPQNNIFYPQPQPQNNIFYPQPQPQNDYFVLNLSDECFRRVNYGFVNLPFTTLSNDDDCSICSQF
ncbi:uncharacterized protein LOC141543640 isoform X4 [Sminthopsis crassicaudata]|uniref:uncharacterized protein LOC141543640 isoform X2 n=1 Tax=Sminthopsis crassicaudata TaxID=9301 RepID=UPI003D69CC1A